jgi:hypothetical protein
MRTPRPGCDPRSEASTTGTVGQGGDVRTSRGRCHVALARRLCPPPAVCHCVCPARTSPHLVAMSCPCRDCTCVNRLSTRLPIKRARAPLLARRHRPPPPRHWHPAPSYLAGLISQPPNHLGASAEVPGSSPSRALPGQAATLPVLPSAVASTQPRHGAPFASAA